MTTKINIENVTVAVRTRDDLVRITAATADGAGVKLSFGIEPDAARELAGQLLTCADAVEAGEDVEPCEECGELLFGVTLRRDMEGIPLCAAHYASAPVADEPPPWEPKSGDTVAFHPVIGGPAQSSRLVVDKVNDWGGKRVAWCEGVRGPLDVAHLTPVMP